MKKKCFTQHQTSLQETDEKISSYKSRIGDSQYKLSITVLKYGTRTYDVLEASTKAEKLASLQTSLK